MRRIGVVACVLACFALPGVSRAATPPVVNPPGYTPVGPAETLNTIRFASDGTVYGTVDSSIVADTDPLPPVLWRSTDHGRTWRVGYQAPEGTHVILESVSPADPGIVYVTQAPRRTTPGWSNASMRGAASRRPSRSRPSRSASSSASTLRAPPTAGNARRASTARTPSFAAAAPRPPAIGSRPTGSSSRRSSIRTPPGRSSRGTPHASFRSRRTAARRGARALRPPGRSDSPVRRPARWSRSPQASCRSLATRA
jgi:hypothetical protein